MDNQIRRTPAALIILAWLFVGLPWTWGVTQLWKNARKLFQAPAATVLPSATSGTNLPPAPSSK